VTQHCLPLATDVGALAAAVRGTVLYHCTSSPYLVTIVITKGTAHLQAGGWAVVVGALLRRPVEHGLPLLPVRSDRLILARASLSQAGGRHGGQ
jgi:hypothetical protein